MLVSTLSAGMAHGRTVEGYMVLLSLPFTTSQLTYLQFDSLVQATTGFNIAEAEVYKEFLATQGLEFAAPAVRPFPIQILDHAAGHFLAAGVNAALAKTITVRFAQLIPTPSIYSNIHVLPLQEGGSWEVRVSLAGVGEWLRTLGRLDAEQAFGEATKRLPPRELGFRSEELESLLVDIPRSPMDKKRRRRKPTANADALGENAFAEGRVLRAITHAAKLEETPVRNGTAPLIRHAHAAQWLPRDVPQP
jgi:hypothetical protein